jgi:hypothetical protein
MVPSQIAQAAYYEIAVIIQYIKKMLSLSHGISQFTRQNQ